MTVVTVVVTLATLLFVTIAGVIVRPISSVTTNVDVEVTSGGVVVSVVVNFSMLVLVTSAPVIVTLSRTLRTVVDITSAAVTVTLAVMVFATVTVVYAVTTGSVLVAVELVVDVESDELVSVCEIHA